MIKVLIIDDERPARSELRYLVQKYWRDVDIFEAGTKQEAVTLMELEEIDLAFIDINLGDTEGTVLAGQFKKIYPGLEVVFATAYNNYAETAFAVDALHYILKPFDEEKVIQTLKKYESRRDGKSPLLATKLPIPYEKKVILVDIEDIVYIETEQRHCVIYTKCKRYKGTGSINSYEQKLRGRRFFRIQKSYLINLEYVSEIYTWFQNTTCVKLKGFEDQVISVSRSKLKELRQLFDM